MSEPAPFMTGPVSERAHRMLDLLHDRDLNFDLGIEPDPAEGWHIDDYCQNLPPEPPGPPADGATFRVAQELMTDYEFADPSIVRAVYYSDRPLADRDMVLEARFYGLKFYMGLRVGGVIDEVVEFDGRTVHRWGWNYRTLAGHLEMGQMDYEVWKWDDTGEVQFRIHAFSRPARIVNPIVRLGFAVFGRGMQKRFARRALARMRRLVSMRLIEKATGAPLPRESGPREDVRVEPAARADVRLPADR
jgi:uncharacterized protein (UPF0548 family)